MSDTNNLPFQPNSTQIPNVFFDYWMGVLSHSEFKILMAISRKTFGWHKKRDSISRTQIVNLTGLNRDTVRRGIKKLEEHSLLIKYEQKSKLGDNDPNLYEINVVEEIVISKAKEGVGVLKANGGRTKRPTKESSPLVKNIM